MKTALISVVLALVRSIPLASDTVSAPVPTAVPAVSTTNQVDARSQTANMGINGNGAQRDQTNNAVSQNNNAQSQQVIGTQSNLQEVNNYQSNSTIQSESNVNVTNTDQSLHSFNETSIVNDNAVTHQKTINNNQANIVNTYEVAPSSAGA
ncbi:hypothetical protein HDU91_001494, partial [Kappamyces sp. JEL0680]